MQFQVAQRGAIVGLRFYKGPGNTGVHVGHLWDSAGKALATVTFTDESAAGWQTAKLSAPVTVLPAQTYTVSYHADAGHYSYTTGAFAHGAMGNQDILGYRGTFSYSSNYPTDSTKNTSYYVDVLYSPAASTTTSQTSVYAASAVPAKPSVTSTSAAELGMRFKVSIGGSVTAIRFYKGAENTGQHVGHLWSPTGALLATVTFAAETASGWQTATLSTPVAVQAGQTYTVSYYTSVGHYAYRSKAFANGPIGNAYILGYSGASSSSGYPTTSAKRASFYVDVLFAPSGSTSSPTSPTSTAPTSPSATPTTPTSPSTSTAPTTPSTSSGSTPSGPGPNLPAIAWYGGPAYYGQFSAAKAAGWSNPGFFPLGVWFEGVGTAADVATDKSVGLNSYFHLTSNSNPALVRAAGGMSIVDGALSGQGSETVGDFLDDEADMKYGPGSDKWNGDVGWPNACTPDLDHGGQCGYTAMATEAGRTQSGDGRFRWANYGKGVMFWESDADAARFVNSYTQAVSNDAYWYTDSDVCSGTQGGLLLAKAGVPGTGPIDPYTAGVLSGYPHGVPSLTTSECRRSYNYGLLIDRERALDAMDGKRQPIYAFVEDGCPGSNGACITGPQMQGAIMSSLIHGANGILYFNHSFSGKCQGQHNLRDSCYASQIAAAKAINAEITSLAPVLNSQSYQYDFGSGTDTMLKSYGGSYYIFAMGKAGSTGSKTFTLPTGMGGSQVQVVNENRSLPISGGKFTDTFAQEYSYHVYKITP